MCEILCNNKVFIDKEKAFQAIKDFTNLKEIYKYDICYKYYHHNRKIMMIKVGVISEKDSLYIFEQDIELEEGNVLLFLESCGRDGQYIDLYKTSPERVEYLCNTEFPGDEYDGSYVGWSGQPRMTYSQVEIII